jgi:hypothetical protein
VLLKNLVPKIAGRLGSGRLANDVIANVLSFITHYSLHFNVSIIVNSTFPIQSSVKIDLNHLAMLFPPCSVVRWPTPIPIKKPSEKYNDIYSYANISD